MDKQKFIVFLVVIVCFTAVLVTGAVYLGKRDNDNNYFSVSATGKIYAKPDIANLTIGFQTETKKTAALAVAENSDKMNKIIAALKVLGIEEKDLKTTNYTLNPIYNWTQNKGQELQGYQVGQNVTIKVRDLDKIGKAIASTAEQGANQVGNISFTIDDEEELRTEARKQAINQAKEKALAIVLESGIKLGKIVNVYENQIYYPMPMADKSDMAYGMGGGNEISAPGIEAGENEVRVEVSVVYEVK